MGIVRDKIPRDYASMFAMQIIPHHFHPHRACLNAHLPDECECRT